MTTVTVEIDSRLVRFVRSRAFTVVASLRGVCVSFAPLFLYWSACVAVMCCRKHPARSTPSALYSSIILRAEDAFRVGYCYRESCAC